MRTRRLLAVHGLAVAISVGTLTHSQSAPAHPVVLDAETTPSATAIKLTEIGYLLGPGDVVDIGVVGRKDFDARARVREDGSILLPLVGSIRATDKTSMELAASIRQALIRGEFFADPAVKVDVAAITSRYVTVLGAVGSPGLITLDRNYRLSEIMARVGGRSAGGADCVLLTRAAGGGAEKISLESLATAGPENDPFVAAGDKVFVPPADVQIYYISGQIHSPGSFELARGLTVRKAIAKAGGISENGSERKITVMREGKKLAHVNLDDQVAVGDIIAVGERLF